MDSPSVLAANGRKTQFSQDETILEVCKRTRVPVPTLCRDDRLKPCGGCRLCIVEIKSVPRPLTSCTLLHAVKEKCRT